MEPRFIKIDDGTYVNINHIIMIEDTWKSDRDGKSQIKITTSKIIDGKQMEYKVRAENVKEFMEEHGIKID